MTDARYHQTLDFPDQSPSFAHGFEAGVIHALLAGGMAAFGPTPVHVANHALLAEMAARKGYEAAFAPTQVEGWEMMSARKVRAATGLMVVRSG